MNTTYELLFTEAIQLNLYSELKKKYNLSDDQRLRKHFEWREKKSASTPPSAQYALLWWEQDALSKDKPRIENFSDKQKADAYSIKRSLRLILSELVGNSTIWDELDTAINRVILNESWTFDGKEYDLGEQVVELIRKRIAIRKN